MVNRWGLVVLALVITPTQLATGGSLASHEIATSLPIKTEGIIIGSGTANAVMYGPSTARLVGHAVEIDWYRTTQFFIVDDGPIYDGVAPLGEPIQQYMGHFDTVALDGTARTGFGISMLQPGNIEFDGTSADLVEIARADGSPRHHLPEGSTPNPQTWPLDLQATPTIAARAQGGTWAVFEVSGAVVLYGFQGTVHHSNGAESLDSGTFQAHGADGAEVRAVVHDHLILKGGRFSLGGEALVVAGMFSQIGRIANKGLTSLTVAEPIGATSKIPPGTWFIEGETELRNLRPDAAGDVAIGTLAADPTLFMVDGNEITETLPIGQATATTLTLAAALALVYKVAPYLSPLLTRLPPGKALENDNRKKLYTYICKKPGATFREVLRGTKIPAGTARHHLNVLARSDMIVERGHRSTLRYFENHGKFDGTWEDVVLLREPELKRVYSWVKEHPHAIQKELLEVAEGEWGWSRSTAQHRLARLVDGGLVAFHQAGRRKAYFIVDPAERQQRRPGLGWMSA